MRLWHKDLIPFLPNKQLLAQWRECVAISGNISRLGSPNHILVNGIMNYKLTHFYKYCTLIASEMHRRGYTTKDESVIKIQNITTTDIRMGMEFVTYEELFGAWHNDRYLRQCYYNLQEKYDCGGIPYLEWKIIEDFMGDKLNV